MSKIVPSHEADADAQFGMAVRARRAQLGITLDQLAVASGVSSGALSRVERGLLSEREAHLTDGGTGAQRPPRESETLARVGEDSHPSSLDGHAAGPRGGARAVRAA